MRDARPEGGGLQVLLDQIATFHPCLNRTVVCIDMSSSVDERRDIALAQLKSRFASEPHGLAYELIWFAGTASASSDAGAVIRGTKLPAAPLLEPGTLIEPPVDALRPLVRVPITHVTVVGDGELDDAQWRERLERSLGVKVVLSQATI